MPGLDDSMTTMVRTMYEVLTKDNGLDLMMRLQAKYPDKDVISLGKLLGIPAVFISDYQLTIELENSKKVVRSDQAKVAMEALGQKTLLVSGYQMPGKTGEESRHAHLESRDNVQSEMHPKHRVRWMEQMRPIMENHIKGKGEKNMSNATRDIASGSISSLLFGKEDRNKVAETLLLPVFAQTVRGSRTRAAIDKKYWGEIPDGYMRYSRRVMSYFTPFVGEYTDGKKETEEGLLRHFVDLHKAGKVSKEWVRDQVITMYGAGADTTKHTMDFMLFSLSEHPEIQHKLRQVFQERYQELFGDKQFDDLSVVEMNELIKKIPEINYFVKETLRRYPTAPLTVRKNLEDINIGGENIPAGASIFVPILLMNVDQKYWGSDAMEFNPDRFSPTASAERDSKALMTFYTGIHRCLGESFAYAELELFLTLILGHSSGVERVTTDEKALKQFTNGTMQIKGPVEYQFS